MKVVSIIKNIKAREILDSRGKKTVELELTTNLGKFRSSVPSGTSKGKYEAVALEAKKAVENINKIVAPQLLGRSTANQRAIDKSLDNKLGANSTLPLSIALLRAEAREKKLPLWKYIARIAKTTPKLPRPGILLIEGGLHGETKLDIQEFMVIPGGRTFHEQFSKGKKIYGNLNKILKNKFRKKGTKLGMEGAFTPPISDPREVLDLIIEATRGYNVKIGLDFSGSNLKKGKYGIAFYQKFVRDYPILFLEDPFGEEDWQNWRKLLMQRSQTPLHGSKVLIVGDDLTVTNPKRIKMAQKKKACNAVIIKPNQIGTITEAIEAAKLAKAYGWKVIVSHRSGETKDDFIADFAVGIGADFIKAGAPSRPERMAKYNRLLQIEKEIHG